MYKLKLRNKLLFINLCIVGVVFICQFVFQNIFFEHYYERYQKNKLEEIIKQSDKSYTAGTLNKEEITRLTKNNNILLAILDKKGLPIVGNIFIENLLTIKTDNEEIIDAYCVFDLSTNKINIGSKVEASIYKMEDDDKYYLDSISIGGDTIFDVFEVKEISNNDNKYIKYIKKTEERDIKGEVINYSMNNSISVEHQMNVIDYIFNNKLTNSTECINNFENNYLLMINKTNTGYIIASISLEQSKEIIYILNSFNKYIIIFTIILVILVIYNYSKTIINPVMEMKDCAKDIANQNFNHHIELKSNDELHELAEALNSISNNLENKINNLEKINDKLKLEYEERLEIEKNQKRLLMNISHDLKTPLTIIKGYLKAIKDGVYEKEEYIDLTIESVDIISNTLSDMLELTKFQSKSLELHKEHIDLTRIIYKTFNNIIHLSKEKNLTVDLDLLDDVFIDIDKNSIIKVFENLFSNAIKYSPKHNNIYIKLFQEEISYIFTIENTGVHIPEDEIKYVFNEFYRVDKSRNEGVKGNGLGLGIIKIILDKHGLEYSINNTDDGVVFTIIFN